MKIDAQSLAVGLVALPADQMSVQPMSVQLNRVNIERWKHPVGQ